MVSTGTWVVVTCTVLCLTAQSCPTLCDPMDCSPPGSSVRRILQAGTLEWVAMPSSRGSSQPRGGTERVKGWKARGLQTEEIGCKC